jgi:hypothetical protein
MPTTMLSWLRATSRPRTSAGAISAMYIGAATDDPPMASPPRKRKNTSADQLHARPQPSADTT